MMGLAMGLRKGLVLLLSTAALGACLPRPEEPIEYLQRPDAVIIQMKTVDDPESELDQQLTVPEFTLYGDGTLILTEPGPGGFRVLKAKVPAEVVKGLLEYIVDKNVLEFNYGQPRLETATSQATTYLYVHTKFEANAVSAYALNIVLPEGEGGANVRGLLADREFQAAGWCHGRPIVPGWIPTETQGG